MQLGYSIRHFFNASYLSGFFRRQVTDSRQRLLTGYVLGENDVEFLLDLAEQVMQSRLALAGGRLAASRLARRPRLLLRWCCHLVQVLSASYWLSTHSLNYYGWFFSFD